MNALITLLGWFAWNVIIFRIDKDQKDKDGIPFPLKQYALQSYDNWLASFAVACVLLWVGYKQFHIEGAFVGLDEKRFEWSDFYYLTSGFVTELIIFAWKKYKAARGQ